MDSSHPAVIRSANVPFTPISDDLYQKATEGENVQAALKDIVGKAASQILPTGTSYVLCLRDAHDQNSAVTTPSGDYILVLLKDGRHGMIPRTAYSESLRIAPPLSELTWKDGSTGLRWTLEDNGSDINWFAAKEYCATLKVGGLGGWQLPTIKDFDSIYTKYTETHLKGGIRLAEYAWTNEITPDNPNGRFYWFTYPSHDWAPANDGRHKRAICVHH
jgi:hypothetical protein